MALARARGGLGERAAGVRPDGSGDGVGQLAERTTLAAGCDRDNVEVGSTMITGIDTLMS